MSGTTWTRAIDSEYEYYVQGHDRGEVAVIDDPGVLLAEPLWMRPIPASAAEDFGVWDDDCDETVYRDPTTGRFKARGIVYLTQGCVVGFLHGEQPATRAAADESPRLARRASSESRGRISIVDPDKVDQERCVPGVRQPRLGNERRPNGCPASLRATQRVHLHACPLHQLLVHDVLQPRQRGYFR